MSQILIKYDNEKYLKLLKKEIFAIYKYFPSTEMIEIDSMGDTEDWIFLDAYFSPGDCIYLKSYKLRVIERISGGVFNLCFKYLHNEKILKNLGHDCICLSLGISKDRLTQD